VKVKIPASCANLGPGFDTLGLAVSIYNTVEINSSSEFSIEVLGEGKDVLPRNKDNLVYRSIKRFSEHFNCQLPNFSLRLENNIPLSRGLGSSAAAIVGGLMAANQFCKAGKSKKDIFSLACQIEGHPDNIAASLVGGLTISFKKDRGLFDYQKVKLARNWQPLILISSQRLSTEAARQVLPNNLTYSQTVFNLSRLALLVNALSSGDLSRMPIALEDQIHQPYRRDLIKGYGDLISICRQNQLIGPVISGAGPSLLGFVTQDQGKNILNKLKKAIARSSLNYLAKLVEVDTIGAQLLP
jgi:homoserine kinase